MKARMISKVCAIGDIEHLRKEYLQQLSSPFDSFLEEQILASTFYVIQDESDSKDVGYMAVHNNEKMTQFYIRRQYLRHAQKLFLEALERHDIKSLFVPTGDELLLSLAIDQDLPIKKQAYFFQDGGGDEPEYRGAEEEVFRLAAVEDLQAIEQVCGDFLHDYERWVAHGELFVYYRGADLLGIGVMEKSKLLEGLASIGMFTNEAFRQQGIGKAIIVQLRSWCKRHGLKPISGCWYYNEASKRTLESAGMVTKTRLLYIEAAKPLAE